MLQKIFESQKRLQSRLGYDFDAMTEKERVDYIKEYSIHATQEMHEMLRELPYFKPWSKAMNNMDQGQRNLAFNKAEMEYVDFFHFAINIALALGLSSTDLFNLYNVKNSINHVRQDENY